MNTKEQLNMDLQNIEETAKIARALASNARLDILRIIQPNSLNISEIAEKMNIPISSAALHIKVLEDAGLVITKSLPGLRGSQKVCGLKIERVDFMIQSMAKVSSENLSIMSESMPIGNYFDCKITAPCGITTKERLLEYEDSIYGFFSPERHLAQLLWFTAGYVEYRFPNAYLKKIKNIRSLEFSLEICSEAPGYNNNWKSDITFWINGIEAGHFTSPADFGSRKGKLNPDWWWEGNRTQFGLLKGVSVTAKGTFIEGERVSLKTFDDYNLTSDYFLSFRIGIKEDAKYVGGLNLFGEEFGDYPQNIHMDIIY